MQLTPPKAHGAVSETHLQVFFALIADIMLTCAGRCNDADMHEESRGMLGVPIGTLHGLLGF